MFSFRICRVWSVFGLDWVFVRIGICHFCLGVWSFGFGVCWILSPGVFVFYFALRVCVFGFGVCFIACRVWGICACLGGGGFGFGWIWLCTF